ncbi:hypothetical protein AB0L13_16015 [Saccharopolyspora shandongensis]|uniref:hypothetical protein n=1 Tax=Saccharopolyspora shandongensis TaxID=418495 RepID=UPI003428983B
MPSDTSSAGNLVRRIAMTLFKLGLVVFLLLGVIVVGAQAIGVVTANAGLVSGVVDGLGKAMTVAAGVTGLLGFTMSYLFKWQNAGED